MPSVCLGGGERIASFHPSLFVEDTHMPVVSPPQYPTLSWGCQGGGMASCFRGTSTQTSSGSPSRPVQLSRDLAHLLMPTWARGGLSQVPWPTQGWGGVRVRMHRGCKWRKAGQPGGWCQGRAAGIQGPLPGHPGLRWPGPLAIHPRTRIQGHCPAELRGGAQRAPGASFGQGQAASWTSSASPQLPTLQKASDQGEALAFRGPSPPRLFRLSFGPGGPWGGHD